jgi:integrase/recombinase XerD
MSKRTARKKAISETLLREVERTANKERAITTFDTLQKEFLQECEIKDYANETLTYYSRELKYVRKFLIEAEAPIDDIAKITGDHLQEIVAIQKQRNLKSSTIHARMRAARTLFRWAASKGKLDRSPMEGVVVPKPRHQVGATFTKRQLKRLLEAPDLSTFIGLRDYVLMLTFAHTGARVSEIADLTLQNVSFEEGAIMFVRTKNGKARRIPMTRQLKKALSTWIKVRGLELDTDALFITQTDEPMCARAMQRRLQHYGEHTGVNKEVSVSPHAFRRTFAKLKVQSGVDLFTIQALMGHSSLDQLKQYVILYSEDLAQGVEAGINLD